jgi:ABC-2 type transport system ATP-binding protein
MQQLVDEVVIIHHGKLIAHGPVTELTARAAGGTRVRSPQAAALQEALGQAGFQGALDGDQLVTPASPERVGELAAANGIVLHELVADATSLEEAFLELTGGDEIR